MFHSDKNNNVKTTCVDTHDFTANGGKFTNFEFSVKRNDPFSSFSS